MEADNEMMDWGLYGMLIRRERTRAGYKRADEFTASIYRRTRVKISRDVYYKIEQGKQTPNATQLAAINLSLYGKAFPGWLVDRLASREWIEIESQYAQTSTFHDVDNGQYIDTSYSPSDNPYIPDAWKSENADALIEKHPELLDSARKQADANSCLPDYSGDDRLLQADIDAATGRHAESALFDLGQIYVSAFAKTFVDAANVQSETPDE